VEHPNWEHIAMREDERQDSITPVIVLCFLVQLLALAIGIIVELAGGKGNLLWEISICLFTLAGAIMGINMIVTKRAFYKSRDYVGKNAVAVGSIYLLVFGSIFACFIVDVLRALL
jgi:hypothetical protein